MLYAAVEVLLFIEREFHNERATLNLVHFPKYPVINVPQFDARLAEIARRTWAVLDYRP